MPSTDIDTEPVRFWESHYRRRRAARHPRPNPLLTEVASALPPGRALDLGCGSGGDTLWLAGRGWQVTAVDISATAVRRVAGLASAHDLDGRVRAERHDLAAGFPDGRFEFVNAQYLHTPFGLDRPAVLRRAAAALTAGGRLLVVDHGSIAPWSWNRDPDTRFPSADEVAAGLDLDPDRFVVERADHPRRLATGPRGRRAEVVDHVLVVRRTGSGS